MSLQERPGAEPESGFLPVESPPRVGPRISVGVDVTPQKKEGPDGDIILLGYLGGSEVEVVFKRSEGIRPLLTLLTQMLKAAKARQAAEGLAPPNVSKLRCPLQIEGAWQVRLHFDENDMPVRHYQLVVSRWRARRKGKAA